MTGTAAAGLSVRSAADGKGVTGADQDRVPRRVAPPMAHFAGMASANMPEAPFVLIGALINGKGSGGHSNGESGEIDLSVGFSKTSI